MYYGYFIASYGAENWTLRKVDQKYLESFEIWCWGWMEIIWTERVNNEDVLHTAKEGSNMICTIHRRNVKWIGHTVHRN
jgi:hypothetical protein